MNRSKIIQKAKGARRRLKSAARKLSSPARPASVNKPAVPNPPNYGDGNKVINQARLINGSRIIFKGKNNILYFEDPNMLIEGRKIVFEGDNAVIYWSKHSNKNRKQRANIYSQSGTVTYIGRDVNFHIGAHNETYIMASENKNIIIGDDCLFSLGLWIRTADGHAAYDSNTKQRLNFSKSVLIGDHVWLGQNLTILKGSRIGSGSIIGANSTLTGKSYPSNSSIAGSPARLLKTGVFFNKPNINSYTNDQLKELEACDTDEWIYKKDKNTLDFDKIDKDLQALKTSTAKLAYIKKNLAGNHDKNRFYNGEENSAK